jgi:hypothetical protein
MVPHTIIQNPTNWIAVFSREICFQPDSSPSRTGGVDAGFAFELSEVLTTRGLGIAEDLYARELTQEFNLDMSVKKLHTTCCPGGFPSLAGGFAISPNR